MNSRTPRNFDGTRSPGVKIEELLPQILGEIEKKNKIPAEAVFREWNALLGEKMAPLTRPVSFADGVLTVIVKSSTLYSLLRAHEKVRLQGMLRKKFPVKDIVLKIG
jgi:predicted nucleic acid-binding Zn ribbon protein